MKITFFIPRLIGGGAERVVANLATFFADCHRYDVCVVTLSNDINSYPISSNVKIYPLGHSLEKDSRIIRWMKKLYRFLKYICSDSSDINVSFLNTVTLICLFFKPLMKGRLICAERNYPGSYPKWEFMLLKKLSVRANAWVFQTRESAELYPASLAKKYFIQNAVNIPFFENVVKKEKIVAVGRLHPQKNFKVLIEAFSKIADRFPRYHLYIYGEGHEYQNLKRVTAQFKVEDRVHFIGFVKNIYQELVDAEIFVMSSNYEGIPNALLEAMALGLPCIATNCLGGGARLLIDNRENGILVPCNNETAISNAIEELIEDKALRNSISSKAVDVREKYSAESVFKKWNDVFKDVLN